MPAKLASSDSVPTLVRERLIVWGRAIRTQRIGQRITAADLAARMRVSRATLQRMEHGDPGVAAATYLAALQILGLIDHAAPPLDALLWSDAAVKRVRLRQDDRDDDAF